MANKISTILDLDGRGFDKSVKNIRKSIAEADGSIDKMRAGVTGLGGVLKTYGTEAAAAAGAALIAFSVKSVSAFKDLALESGRLSEALGLTTEEASRYIEVAGDLGIESSSLEAVLGKMNQTAGRSPQLFSAIGAELVKNADGSTNVSETFLSVVDALQRIEDPYKRAAAAQQIFGRSWRDSAELISMSSWEVRDALAAVSDQKVIDAKELERARKMRESMDNLGDSVEDVALAFGETLTPTVIGALKTIVGAIEGTRKTWNFLNEPLFGDKQAESIHEIVAAERAAAEGADLASRAFEARMRAMQGNSVASSELTTATDLQAIADEDATEAAKKATDERERAAEKIKDQRDATVDLIEATMELGDSSVGYRNQQARTSQTIDQATKRLNEAEQGSADYEQASRDMESAVYDQAAAAVRYAEDQAKANGQTLTAEEKSAIYRSELEKLAGYLSGPAALAVLGYVNALRLIPSDINTRISTSGVGGPGTSINRQTGAPQVANRYGAEGGIVTRPTQAIIGEAGPEMVLPLNTAPGASPLPKNLGLGGNMVVNVYTAADPNSVIDAIRKYARTTGVRIPGITS